MTTGTTPSTACSGRGIIRTVPDASGAVLSSAQHSYDVTYSRHHYGVNLVNQWSVLPSTVNPGSSFWQQEATLSGTPYYYPGYHLILEYALNQADVTPTSVTETADGVTTVTSAS